jgi:hypothetical protein
MQQSQGAPAQSAQAQAQAALAQARSALSQAAAQASQTPSPSSAQQALGSPAVSQGQQHTAQKGAFEYGRMSSGEKEAQWNVALPPRERAEVEQAIKEKMPARYRRQITLYYQNLAGTKGE